MRSCDHLLFRTIFFRRWGRDSFAAAINRNTANKCSGAKNRKEIQLNPLSKSKFLSTIGRYPAFIRKDRWVCRFWALSSVLRMRTDRGVTSSCSSSRIKLMACSSVIGLAGDRITFSSLPAARMLLNFFSLQGFTLMSSLRLCSPTIIPS